ncbi:MAG TPA: extracellular solute-binding protein [Alphaproteobacteria bacterium]|jgi:ABC-type Fe3+ transport system substrate-binding protein
MNRSVFHASRAFAAGALLLAVCLPAFAADWQDGAGPEWEKVLQAARQEGKVVVGGRADLGKPMSDAFKRDTGLTLDFLGGESRDISGRFIREVRSGNVIMDFMLGGAGNGIDLAKQGFLVPLKAQLMLPGVTDPKNWAGGRLKWVDKTENYMAIGGEYIFGWPVFNSSVIKPGEITAWTDLLKPQYKGKIAAYDPRSGGPGQAAAAYLGQLYGEDFLRRLYVGQDVTFTRSGPQLAEWAVRGVHPIMLGGLATDIEKYRRAGIDTLAVGEMTDGPGSLLGGSSVIFQAKGSPHPNAATVYLNWYLSKPGQDVYSTVWETPSRRLDVQVPSIPAYTVPKPGIAYLDQYEEDWYVNARPKLEKAVIEVMGGQ